MKKLSSSTVLFLLAMLISMPAAQSAQQAQKVNDIIRPILNTPVLVKAGDSFPVEFSRDIDKKADRILLTSMGEQADMQITGSSDTGATVSVPNDFPEALYDLQVIFNDGSSDIQPHSVKVLKEFKETFDFVHFTDIHFNSGREGGPDVNPIRAKLLQEISALDPEFVLFSGDLGLNPETYSIDYEYGYEQFLEHMKAPMFMVPGNHEMYVDNRPDTPIDGKSFWDTTYGPTYNSFDYGNLHVVGINDFDWAAKFRDRWDQDLAFFGTQGLACISPGQWKWLVDDLKTAKAAGKNIIAYTHIPIGNLQGGRKIGFQNPEKIKGPDPDLFIKLMNKFEVSHIFIGHLHYNEIKEFGNFKQVMTVTAGSGDIREAWGFRIVHVKNGKVTGWDIHDVGFDDLK